MGTRNLIMVKYKSDIKVAKYCQWDGYPSGQGADLLEILKTINLDLLKEKILKIENITEEKLISKYKELSIDVSSGFISFDDSAIFKEKYPYLDRDMGAKIVSYIVESEENLSLDNCYMYGSDRSGCEWFYLVDLDDNKFYIHNYLPLKKPTSSEMTSSNVIHLKENAVKIYSLEDLPSIENFLSDFAIEE